MEYKVGGEQGCNWRTRLSLWTLGGRVGVSVAFRKPARVGRSAAARSDHQRAERRRFFQCSRCWFQSSVAVNLRSDGSEIRSCCASAAGRNRISS